MTTWAKGAAARTALVAILILVTVVTESAPVADTPVASAAPATGTLLKTVTIPSSAACGQGSSLGLVAGRMLGQQFAAFPILLATSCNGSSTISFLDPNSAAGPNTTAALVRTITTSAAPSSGWRALSARPDKSDLFGCGNTGSGNVAVYSIQVGFPNALVSTPVGTATQLLTAPSAGGSFCDGLAWDSSDKSIFEGPHSSAAISHFSQTGVPLNPATVNSPCPITNGSSSTSGLAVGGASLFVACGADTEIFQIDKTGANRFSFPPFNVGKNIEGLECDPASFAASGSAALWARDASLNQVYAFALPRFQCGLVGGASAPFGAQCPATWSGGVGDTTSTAQDGLLDCWKVQGIDINGDGIRDFPPASACASVCGLPGASTQHHDIYLEIDSYSTGCTNGPVPPTCAPSPDVVNALVAAFNNAPVPNPDGTTGIHLHVLVDDSMPVTGPLAFEPCTLPAAAGSQDFDALKAQFFGTSTERSDPNAVNILGAKAFVYHYMLSVDTLQGLSSTSGCSELPGNDSVVALGHLWSYPSSADVAPSWAGTIMHELGHNLGLRHGGGAAIDTDTGGVALSANCKPNYLSVMSYALQMPDRPVPLASWKLDYSRIALPTLNEGALDESVGVFGTAANQPLLANGTNPFLAVFGLAAKNGGTQLLMPNASLPINWDGDRVAPPYQVVSGNINNQGAGTGCDGSGVTLSGWNDWVSNSVSNPTLQYDFHTSLDFADGVHLTVTTSQEITKEQADAIAANAAPVFTIYMPAPTAVGNTLAYTVTVANNGPKPATNVTIVDTLPPGTTFVSSQPASCSVAGGLVTCNLGTVPVGTGNSIAETLVFAPTQTPITNVVAVSSDPDTAIFQPGATQSSPPVTNGFSWSGFFSPTQNFPAMNQANAGSQVPLKFSLGGNFGTDVFASGFPQQQQIDCGTLVATTGPTPIPPAGFTLNFNAGNNQYNFNWKSDPAWAGTCRQISLQLNDGTPPHLALFQFK